MVITDTSVLVNFLCIDRMDPSLDTPRTRVTLNKLRGTLSNISGSHFGGAVGWHAVAEADALGDDEALGVKVGQVPIAIVRAGGMLHAVHDVCTHQYALLSDGYVEDGCIECPLHQGRFDLITGNALCAPVTEPVKVYPVRVESGKIMVELND